MPRRSSQPSTIHQRRQHHAAASTPATAAPAAAAAAAVAVAKQLSRHLCSSANRLYQNVGVGCGRAIT